MKSSLSWLVQGGQPYWSFPFSEDSLSLPARGRKTTLAPCLLIFQAIWQKQRKMFWFFCFQQFLLRLIVLSSQTGRNLFFMRSSSFFRLKHTSFVSNWSMPILSNRSAESDCPTGMVEVFVKQGLLVGLPFAGRLVCADRSCSCRVKLIGHEFHNILFT